MTNSFRSRTNGVLQVKITRFDPGNAEDQSWNAKELMQAFAVDRHPLADITLMRAVKLMMKGGAEVMHQLQLANLGRSAF